MEQITDCRYADESRRAVACLINGQPASVPVAEGNRHWEQIVRDQIPIADPE